MLKNILIGVAVVVVGLLALIMTRPDRLHVERSHIVEAPPEVVYDQVSDLRAWAAWSPWEALDPNQRKTFTGPERGQGASLELSGNEDVGRGRMTITESVRPKRVAIDLEFIEPFESKSTTSFRLEPEGPHTLVTWTMDGKNDLIMKAMSLFMDFDAMIGADYEKGLTTLAEVSETRAAEIEAERAAAEAAVADATEEAIDEAVTTP
jgi:hypothetical protein